MYLTINERLFSLLGESGKTQKALADSIGVNERNIGTWKARGSDPPAKLIYQIAAFLGVSVEWLLTGEEHHATNIVGGNVTGGTVMQGTHNSRVVVSNEKQRPLTDEEGELLRLFQSLDVKRRVKLLDFSFTLEEEMKAGKTQNVEVGF